MVNQLIGNDVIIRKAEVYNIDEIRKLIIEVSKYTYKDINPKILDAIFSYDSIKYDLTNGYSIIILINNIIIATGNLTNNYISHVYIKKCYQHCGLGKTIITELERHAIKTGIKKLIVGSHKGVIGFYSKLGYKIKRKITKDIEEDIIISYYILEKQIA